VLNRLDTIHEINTEDLYGVADTGVITADFAAAAAREDLLYPPDPGSMKISTLGGNVAENAGGLRGLKYGVTRDYIQALDVILPTGDFLHTGAITVKSVAGYDLTRLLVGSEGTLGVVTKIWCRLIPTPEHKESMMAIFDEMGDAAEAVAAIIRAGVIPATLEFLDQITIRAIESYKSVGLPEDAGAVLLIETDGRESSAKTEAAIVMDICKQCRTKSITIAADDRERDRLWEGRRSALSALARVRPTVILEDATVPRSNIPAMVRGVQDIAKRHGIQIGNFGHAGDGNLHPTLLLDERNHEELERAEQAIDDIFDLALSLGGTLSGEHGIGMAKARYLHREMGEAGVKTMRAIKKALDPNNILNPGKMALSD